MTKKKMDIHMVPLENLTDEMINQIVDGLMNAPDEEEKKIPKKESRKDFHKGK